MALKPEQKKFVEAVFGEQALTDLDEAGKAIEEAGAAFKDYLAPSDAETVPAAPADDAPLNTDLKALLGDLLTERAEFAQLLVAGARKQSAEKDAFDARLEDLTSKWGERFEAQAKEIAALKEQLDSRPKQASTATETELTSTRLSAIEAQAEKQLEIVDPFWGTKVPVTPIGA